jgi:hypothetical protein
MHGDEKVVEEDVRGVGKTIGLQLEGGTGNTFSVLSRGERRKKMRHDLVLGEEGGTGERRKEGGRRGEGLRGVL